MPKPTFIESLAQFAHTLTANFASGIPAQPEDQLKAPTTTLLQSLGEALHVRVTARTEAQVHGLGARPDIGVAVDQLLTGHVELKAPGKGAQPRRFKDDDLRQWEKFKSLPNLMYTDGSEWTLFRSGEQVVFGTGEHAWSTVRFSGSVTTDGPRAVSAADAQKLRELLSNFLHWQPVVPSSPRALAELLAPLCRFLRDDVAAAVANPDSNLAQLANEWRRALFPDADDAQFADAYAQTLTYALLLARWEGQEDVTPALAAERLDSGHALLAQTLRILGQAEARAEIGLGIELLVRLINAVDPDKLRRAGHDPWLYFYEHFLAAYDPKLRKQRGVYYTPPQVIRSQVRLIAELLRTRFHKPLTYADPEVVLLDPAAGTGAYLLAALQHGLDHVARQFGPGSRSGYASDMARNIHAFEVLVGPYAVAHLLLTQKIIEEGAALPTDGVHVYLTDTLEAPHAQPPTGQHTLMYKRLTDEHKRAQTVKSKTRVLVCMGNPPYSRQEIAPDEKGVERRGGWVRFGDHAEGGILEDFLAPAREAGAGLHLKNLYNDYVYFWRWALWKVFESESSHGPGIVSFITAASYLRGPGFVGMRKVMRQIFDDLWIIDLEGDSLGARKTENVFAIQIPVAIAIGVRYGAPQPDTPATGHYTRLTGTSDDKLHALDLIRSFAHREWQLCFSGWMQPFLPLAAGSYFDWPLLTDIFPWQYSGVQFKRTWPIGETKAVLQARWRALVSAPSDQRAALFREAGRKVIESARSLHEAGRRLKAISSESATAPVPTIVRYAYRSLDRQWVFKDPRVCDRIRPPLWRTHSPHQVYLTSLLTDVLGLGPAAIVTAEVPDLHHFHGRGAKDVIPLWRDSAATQPNVTSGLLNALSAPYRSKVKAEDLFAYCYAILATPAYVERFSEELTIPGPRLPLTKDPALFRKAASLGRKLIRLHTYGERFLGSRATTGRVPQGKARNTRPIPTASEDYPKTFAYDEPTRTLHVGPGAFAPVSSEAWRFSVSGLQVLRSWLSYRMKKRAGKKSSPLDNIRPDKWTSELTTELLQLLWILEATVVFFPTLETLLDSVVSGPLFTAEELPQPSAEEREPPHPEPTAPQSPERSLNL